MRILCCDGGGIKGAVSASFLNEVEKRLGKSLYDAFDMFAGTSTGGLIAMALAYNKATGKDLIDLYSEKRGKVIMDKSLLDRILPIQPYPKYDDDGKIKVFKEVYGLKKMSEIKDNKKVLITGYDWMRREFATFKGPIQGDSSHDPYLYDIGNITSAAPVYYPPVENHGRWFVDGGLGANNPSMCALAWALKLGVKLEDISLLSVGCGYKDIDGDEYRKTGENSRKWGGIEWLFGGLMDILFDGPSAATNYQCNTFLGDRFLRINGEIEDNSMDDTSRRNINSLKYTGVEWFTKNEVEIKKFFS